MKKTQIIELFSNIRSTFMSFFAIMLFVVLSVGVFAGISWTSPALQGAADEIYDDGNLYDIEIQFSNGLTEEDLQELQDVEGVDELDAGYTSMQMLCLNGKEYVTKITSLTENMNIPVNIDGRLPEKSGEIALNRLWAESKGVAAGDTVTFKHDAGKKDTDGMKYLLSDTYTVTALVDSPSYVSHNLSSYGLANIGSGYIQCLAFTAPESFDASAFPGYVQAYIRSDSLRGLGTSSAEYKRKSQELINEVSALGEKVSGERYNDILEDAKQRISAAEEKLANAEEKIKNAEQKIAQGKKTLKESKAEYAASKEKLDAGYSELVQGQQQYDEAKKVYDDAVIMYQSMEEYRNKLIYDTLTYDDIEQMNSLADEYAGDGKIENPYSDYMSEENSIQGGTDLSGQYQKMEYIDISGFRNTLDYINDNVSEEEWNENREIRDIYREQAVKEIDEPMAEAETMLKTADAELNEKNELLQSGWSQYYAGAEKLAEAKKQIEKGEKTLAQKIEKLEKYKEKYDNSLKSLENYKGRLDLIKDYDWTVLSRENNGGQMTVRQYCDLTDNLRYSMAALFIIIGLLVSYSSISRIVRDQIVSIGTKKALGLRKKEITCSYLAYSGMAVFAGGVLGLAAGTLGIERILAGTIGSRFIMGTYSPYFSCVQGLLLIAVELALILLTTWMACRNVLQQHAVELLKGEKPPSAKPRFFEKWRIWKGLPLLTKTVINNCINDRRRVFGTIIGIAGCTALIVTAVTVDNNIQKSFDWQYDSVYSYDTVIRYNSGVEDAGDNIQKVLDSLGTESTAVYSSPFRLMEPGGRQASVTVTVPFEDDFDRFVHINTSGNAADEEYSDGVWINIAYSVHFDAEPGDRIEIMDSEGQIHEFTVQGFFSHYLFSNQIVMSEEVYNAEFGGGGSPNAFLADSGDLTVQDIKDALHGIKGVRMVKDDYQASFDMFDEFSQIAGAVVIVYLVLSVLMAVIVLFDLYTVFIEEKKRELIILMINGFSVKDARQYIYRDTVVLTILGIILGVAFGAVMGNITIMTLEPDMAYFAKCIDWPACGIGAAVSAVLAIVLCSLAMRRISRFKLSDINKL